MSGRELAIGTCADYAGDVQDDRHEQQRDHGNQTAAVFQRGRLPPGLLPGEVPVPSLMLLVPG